MAGLGSGVNYIPNSTAVQSAIGTNSTTTVLGASGTFTGTWELNTFPDVMINCFADVTGSLFIEFSNDGTNAITDPSLGFSIGPSVNEKHIVPKGPRYFRVRYINDSTAQTTFRLYTYYGDFKANRASLNERIGRDADSNVTRPTSYQDEVSRNLRSGVSQTNKFAYRDDVDTTDGDAMIIADDTTNTPTILTSADTFGITYNSGTDGDSTTGALSLLFTYLDANQNQTTAIHTLGSTGSDTTSFSGLGINRVVVLSSGSANVNTDDITITATTGGSVQAFIPAGVSVTQQLLFHVPTNSSGVSKFIFLSAVKLSGGGGAPRVTFKVFVYNRGVSTQYEVFRYLMDTDVENSRSIVDPVNFPFSAGDVFWVTAATDTNNTSVSARLSLNVYAVD